MIRSFYIDNFKSLVDFRLPMAPHALGRFVCLVGLNGAGKSTVLQALDFMAHMAMGDVKGWLARREWKPSELTSRFLKRQLIHFRIEFEFSPLGIVVWEGAFNTKLLRCTSESISAGAGTPLQSSDQLMVVQPEAFRVGGSAPLGIFHLKGMQFEGSALSILESGHWALPVEAVLDAAANLRSLDTLSPESMRRRAREGRDVGYGGERLSAYIHGLSKPAKAHLLVALREFYPQLQGLTTRSLHAGWKTLSVAEHYVDVTGKPVEVELRHINDGLLRTLAIVCQANVSADLTWQQVMGTLDARVPVGCVLFDEIENGINPELMEKLVTHLLSAGPQVFTTTHSPMILNYLPDEVAQESVVLLYRNAVGHTRAVRLFDLPSVRDKLGLLGPGEAFIDTDLTHLPAEALALERAQAGDAR